MSHPRGLALFRFSLGTLAVVLAILGAGAACAGDEAPAIATNPAVLPVDTARGASQPPAPLLASHPEPAGLGADPAATAKAPAPGKSNDKRLMVLMLLGHAWSSGPFGRLGQ